jgi:RHS repeat-associated protein
MSETLLPLSATQNFTYDAYNRLATAAEGTSWSQTYQYDVSGNANASLGNRYVSTSSGLGILPASFTPTANTNFNSSNQLIVQSSTYDGAGNLKTIGGYVFTYDAENRQTGATVNSAANTYSYDGEGRRVQLVSGGVTTVYVYDAKGELAAEYSTVPPGPAATLYMTGDHLGSTRVTSNATGAAMGYHDYLPFGDEVPSTVGGRGSLYGAPELTQKFTGKERDAETASSAMEGLDYFGARYFSGAQGRFTSPDPLMASAKVSSPQSWNRYSYSFNNPLRFTDPTGMYTCEGTRDQCSQFEKSRAALLKSKDADARRAGTATVRRKTTTAWW